MMNVDPNERFTFERIKHHPWYTRSNPLSTPDGKIKDPLALATQMLESLRIDFNQQPALSQRDRTRSQDMMDIDSEFSRISYTQPETPISDVMFDWERPPRAYASAFSASQPTTAQDVGIATMTNGRGQPSGHNFDDLADEPSMSQFTPAPTVPFSLTQAARRFNDILPNYSLTRFFSHISSEQLLHLLSDALVKLNVPIPSVPRMQGRDHVAWIKIKTVDGRQCSMTGDIVVDTYQIGETELLEVRFVKVKGDPLEWRRFFKSVVVLCKDGVYVPEG
jgi:serine/threonine-protein kinase Chk1